MLSGEVMSEEVFSDELFGIERFFYFNFVAPAVRG